MVRRGALALTVLLAASGCVQDIKENRVKSALVDSGLSDELAGCMAHRMAEKLTIGQLRHLQQLSHATKRSVPEFIAVVRQSGDAEAVEVAITSAALCKAGIIR